MDFLFTYEHKTKICILDNLPPHLYNSDVSLLNSVLTPRLCMNYRLYSLYLAGTIHPDVY